MSRIRILLVDDSAVVRRLVRSALEPDADLEVVGEAANGREALERLELDAPDAMICDVEMPVLSGIETVVAVRRRWPRLPVLMFAAANRESAHITLEALHAGANDFVAKPSVAAGTAMAAVMAELRHELGGKLKALLRGPGDLSAVARAAVRYASSREIPAMPAASPGVPAERTPAPSPPTPSSLPAFLPRPLPAASARPSEPRPIRATPPPQLRSRSGHCEAVLIAVSTGGPNALAELVPRLPADLPVPVLIVQHMPPVFTKLLAERLAAKAQLAVREATDGELLQAGTILIAPGDHHLTVRRGEGGVHCALNRESPENSVRPAADVLFRSASAVWGGRVLVVVMTGMGQDGLHGAIQLHSQGAAVLAQDQATSVVWGMPGAVCKAGIAEEPVPLAQLANAIVHHLHSRRT